MLSFLEFRIQNILLFCKIVRHYSNSALQFPNSTTSKASAIASSCYVEVIAYIQVVVHPLPSIDRRLIVMQLLLLMDNYVPRLLSDDHGVSAGRAIDFGSVSCDGLCT